jgi:hypothetical protein
MLQAILLMLISFWFLGYGPLETFHFPLINFNGHIITLWDILILIAIVWIVTALPRIFRVIVAAFLVVWLLSLLGVITVSGLSNIVVVSLIIGLGIYIIGGR